jgi:hypothetical protein
MEVSVLRNICVYTLVLLVLAFIGTALARPETAASLARQLPTFELMGLPITPVQVQVLGAAHAREQPPAPALMVAGMPATPHQVAVLTPRRKAPQAVSASMPSRSETR